MPEALLTLGPFSFIGLESPERITLKSKQRLAIHHLASGSSQVDSLGVDSASVSFQGIFCGVDAASRIAAIEHLRLQGTPLPLIWGSKALSVIIERFELNYVSNQWVYYHIACYVVSSGDPGGGNLTDEESPSPEIRVSEMLALLQGTDVTPTSAQSAALIALATLDFDTPPLSSLQQVQNLIASINNHMEAQNPRLDADGFIVPITTQSVTAWLAGLVSGSGQQVTLLLASNRLSEISVLAQSVGQP